MMIAGLTGGIASGKSTVSAYFRKEGACIIDADQIARKVVKKGLPAWMKIKEYFGPDVFLPDGEINRDFLGNIIFTDQKKKEMLNAIVHPHVYEEMEKQTRQAEEKQPGGLVIQDIPLLFETAMQDKFFPVIVVWIPESTQLQRLMERNSLTEKDALARIRSQMPIGEKKKNAHIVIDNSGSPEETEKKTGAAYRLMKNTARMSLFGRHACENKSVIF